MQKHYVLKENLFTRLHFSKGFQKTAARTSRGCFGKRPAHYATSGLRGAVVLVVVVLVVVVVVVLLAVVVADVVFVLVVLVVLVVALALFLLSLFLLSWLLFLLPVLVVVLVASKKYRGFM